MPGRVRAAPLPWRYGLLSLLASLLVALAYLALRDKPVVSTIEGQTLNWRFQIRGSEKPPPEAIILAIDDRTVAKLGQPVRRQGLAEAVEKLTADRAAAIGIDLLILEHEQPSNGFQLSPGDQALFDALRGADRGVMALVFTFSPSASITCRPSLSS